jgi:hypothetical protein
MDAKRTRQKGAGHVGKDKNPYDRREEAGTSKAFKSVAKSVKPVAKDTNKTRRPRSY